MLDKYMSYIRYIAAIAIVGMLFFGGCTGSSNITHEASGIIIPNVTPSVVSLTSGESNEVDIVKSGKFSSAGITFSNLNAIPVNMKSYKVEYFDSYTGEKLGTLSFGAAMNFTVAGASATTANTTATSTATPTTSSTTTSSTSTSTTGSSAAPTSSFNVAVVSQKVKAEMYRDTANTTDNRMLTAKMTFYGIDYNGNGLQLDAAVTILP